jgi:hypothetical protein
MSVASCFVALILDTGIDGISLLIGAGIRIIE